MINDSVYWKNTLLSTCKLLRKAEKGTPDVTGMNLSKIEHALVTGFLTIRKLIEAKVKISSSSTSMKCKVYVQEKLKNPPYEPHAKIKDDLEKYIDLSTSGVEVSLDIRTVCNSFVHSYVLRPIPDESESPDDDSDWFPTKIEGYYFVSEEDWPDRIFAIQLSEVRRIFTTIGNDYPDTVSWERLPGNRQKLVARNSKLERQRKNVRSNNV